MELVEEHNPTFSYLAPGSVLKLFATRDISKDEELYLYYGSYIFVLPDSQRE